MYAIIDNGGKQFKVKEGDILHIEKADCKINSFIENKNILLLNNGKSIIIGNPIVKDTKVILKVIKHGKDDKIIVYKFKAKKNYRKKQGHRQFFTEVLVSKIEC